MTLLIEFTHRTLDSWDRLRRLYLEHFVSLRMARATADHERMVELLARSEGERLLKLVVSHNRAARRDYQRLVAQLHRLEKAQAGRPHPLRQVDVRL